jgi:hypothetical protein
MNFIYKELRLFNKKIPLVAILWFVLALVATLSEILRNSINNYLIFKNVFWHVLGQKPLYIEYPAEYFDVNHYGPLFSILIAPFAVLPDWLGCILWCFANAAFLYYSVSRVNISQQNKLIIIAITAVEMMTSIHNLQFNPMVGAWLIMAYVLVEDEKDFWATLFIAAGFLIKLYGIAGLLFFVFSKHKVRFIVSFAFWMIILFCLPMIFSSPSYIINTYKEWFERLVEKDKLNAEGFSRAGHQDISLLGMVRRISQSHISDITLIVPAAFMILIPLLRFKQYLFKQFRLSYLAIVLITVVIFSSSAESATYVIALPGACIWYLLHRKDYPVWSIITLILLFILTILSPTDLVPNYLKDNFIRAYSLKALPCFVIWLWLIADVMFKNFSKSATTEHQL